MKKIKSNVSFVSLISILIISAIYFICPIKYVNLYSYWSNYAFLISSFIIFMGFIPSFKKIKDSSSKFIKLPIIYVSLICLLFEVILFVILTSVNAFVDLKLWISVLINIIFIFITMTFNIPLKSQINNLDVKNKKLEENKIFIKDLKSDVIAFYDSVKDKNLKSRVYELKELILYSDPISNDETLDIEDAINMKYFALKTNYKDQNLDLCLSNIEDVLSLIKERNNICKLSKKK